MDKQQMRTFRLASKVWSHMMLLVAGLTAFLFDFDWSNAVGNSPEHYLWSTTLVAGASCALIAHAMKREGVKRTGLILETVALISMATLSLWTGQLSEVILGIVVLVFAWTLAEKAWILTVGGQFEREAVLGWESLSNVGDSSNSAIGDDDQQ